MHTVIKSVVFETPTTIDIRAFTTFGINSKPNSESPIGYFGTGLKYAISVLVRNGNRVRVFIGKVEYEFFAKSSEFRDKTFDFIHMRKRKGLTAKWKYTELPITTEFGKNWDMWQAFRELESNTRDENGETYLLTSSVFEPENDKTYIVVDDSDFIDCFYDMNDTFLPEALTSKESSENVQMFEQPSKYIYYRGLRVAELPKPSIYTYNILCSISLTEDRTVKYMFMVETYVRDFIMGSKDKTFIKNVIQCEEDDHFEGSLDYDYIDGIGGDTFNEVVSELKSAKSKMLTRVGLYSDRYVQRIEAKEDPRVMISLLKSEWLQVHEELKTQETLPESLEVLEQALENDNELYPYNQDPHQIPF